MIEKPSWSAHRRWVVVAAATLGMMSAFAVSTTVAIVMKPFEAEFGWQRADIALAYTLLTVGTAAGGLVCGAFTDRINTRAIAVFGAAVMAAGLMLLSRQDDLAAIQRIYLAIGVFGFACLYTPLIATVGLWFERGRGVAIGIVTAGGTLGQGIAPLVMQPLISSFGWRDALFMIGVGYAALLVPAMLLVTKPHRDLAAATASTIGQQTARWRLPPIVSIGWLGVAAIFCCVTMAVPLVHVVTLAGDRGFSPALAGSVLTTIMFSGVVGRIAFGIIADRIGAFKSYALASASQTATVFWFVTLDSLPSLYLVAILFGLGFSGVMTTLLLCVREAVPARFAGIGTAVISLLAWAGMGIGAYQGGYCYDATGDYATSFANAAFGGIVNLTVVAGLAMHMHAPRLSARLWWSRAQPVVVKHRP
jgi:MFS family permease